MRDDIPQPEDFNLIVERLRAEFARVAIDGALFVRLAYAELRARMPDRYPPRDLSEDAELPSISLHPSKTLQLLEALPDGAGTIPFFHAWCERTFRALPRF